MITDFSITYKREGSDRQDLSDTLASFRECMKARFDIFHCNDFSIKAWESGDFFTLECKFKVYNIDIQDADFIEFCNTHNLSFYSIPSCLRTDSEPLKYNHESKNKTWLTLVLKKIIKDKA